MSDDPPGYGSPYSWGEEQDYMERPRLRRETDAAYADRKSVTSLSAAIISNLSRVIHRWDY